MNRLHTISISAAAALALAFASCSTAQYRVASVERSRILIDSRYDNSTDPEVVRTNNALLERKKLVDAEMNPVQGHAAENLWVKRPESPLSTFSPTYSCGAAQSSTSSPTSPCTTWAAYALR